MRAGRQPADLGKVHARARRPASAELCELAPPPQPGHRLIEGRLHPAEQRLREGIWDHREAIALQLVQVPLHLKRWREVRRAPSVWRGGARPTNSRAV